MYVVVLTLSFANTIHRPLWLYLAETWTSLLSFYSKLWISLAAWGTATSLAKVERTTLFHSSKRLYSKSSIYMIL